MLLISTSVFGQWHSQEEIDPHCQTMDVLRFQEQQSTEVRANMEAIEQFTQQALRRKSRSTTGIITIPVVFHILYNDEASNISEDQILSQLNVINEDFRNRNENRGDTPEVFKDREADVEIEFCLANVDPNGYKTSGITRTETYHPSFWINAVGFNLMKFDATGGRDAWPADQYLNVWVCRAIESGLLGYAQFPGGPSETDGVVIDYRFFGTVGEVPLYPTFSGRTATHEIGHWLNLRHIWGDGDCTVDDFVDDTPLQSGPNSGYAYPCTFPGPNSCDEGEGDLPDMFQNYMDYSNDDCYTLFTKGQKARMRALFEPGGPRESLLYSKGCASGLDLLFAQQPFCTDGIRNGTETGVDCGGSCDPCPIDRYCLSVGDIPFVKWIGSVGISGPDIVNFENYSSLDFGYGDYTDLSIILKPGNTYNLHLNPEYEDDVFAISWNVFVDYNNDNDFEDDHELVYDSGVPIFDEQVPDDGSVKGTFTVPADAKGSARMRVVMKLLVPGFDLSPLAACGVYGAGETEDYTLSFEACDPPENIYARIQGGDIILAWGDVLSASSYKVRYSSGGLWQHQVVYGQQFRLNNPGPGVYSFQVYALCNGDWSSKGKQITVQMIPNYGGHRLAVLENHTKTIAPSLDIQQLYPNPATEHINIQFTVDVNTTGFMEIRDMLGRHLFIQQFEGIGGSQSIELPITNLASGIYYLTLQSGESFVTKKFVKE